MGMKRGGWIVEKRAHRGTRQGMKRNSKEQGGRQTATNRRRNVKRKSRGRKRITSVNEKQMGTDGRRKKGGRERIKQFTENHFTKRQMVITETDSVFQSTPHLCLICGV